MAPISDRPRLSFHRSISCSHTERLANGAEHARGAFSVRNGERNPLPFEVVGAKGRDETFGVAGKTPAALTLWCHTVEKTLVDPMRRHFAAMCAREIVTLLNDPSAGFTEAGGFARLQLADIAVLVRTGKGAGFMRRALQKCGASVYLSD